MRSSKLLIKIIKDNHMERFIITYLALILVCCAVVMAAEPGINNMADAIWYIFALITSTGFGDFIAVSLVGRTVSILLGIYSIFVIALMTALVIDLYQEKLRIRQNESIMLFLDKMERLPELSSEELADMSEKVKAFKKKRS